MFFKKVSKKYQIAHDNLNDEWFMVDISTSKKYNFYCKIKADLRPSIIRGDNKPEKSLFSF